MKKMIRRVFLLAAMFFLSITYSGAYFTDSVTISGNQFNTGTWEDPEPEPDPAYGDIVINEIMWMGSNDLGSPSHDGPNDQWVELKNVSSKELHIKDWYLTYKSNAGNELELLEIGDNRVLQPGEYYLATYYTKNNSAINVNPDSDDLNNFGYQQMQIKLYTDSTKTTLIDVAGDGINPPSKGDGANFYSMERKDPAGDGSDYNNWMTCLDPLTTTIYWDCGRVERGTPGGPNV